MKYLIILLLLLTGCEKKACYKFTTDVHYQDFELDCTTPLTGIILGGSGDEIICDVTENEMEAKKSDLYKTITEEVNGKCRKSTRTGSYEKQ